MSAGGSLRLRGLGLAPTVPSGFPTEFRAGDTVKFTYSHPDFPTADSWVLSFTFAPIAEPEPRFDSQVGWITVANNEWTVTIPASSTAPLPAGAYGWAAFATLAGERYTAATGTTVVLANLATVTQGQLQSDNALLLARVTDEIKARITGTGGAHDSYTVHGRQLNKIPLKDLMSMRGALIAAVRAETTGSPFITIREVHRRDTPCGSDAYGWGV